MAIKKKYFLTYVPSATTPIQFQNSSSESTYVNTRNINNTTIELVARRCDNTVNNKWVNSCVLEHFLSEGAIKRIEKQIWKHLIQCATNVTFSKFPRPKNSALFWLIYQSIDELPSLSKAKHSNELFSSLELELYIYTKRQSKKRLNKTQSHKHAQCMDRTRNETQLKPQQENSKLYRFILFQSIIIIITTIVIIIFIMQIFFIHMFIFIILILILF